MPGGGAARLLSWIESNRPDLDRELVRKAVDVAQSAHEGQRRKSGMPFVEHTFEVARLLAEEGLDAVTVAAGVLHDLIEDTELSVGDIERDFGREVAFLVDGVTKMDFAPGMGRELRQAETFRKMLLSVARDPRVLLIKFADRLHNLRTLRWMEPEKRRRIAQESLEVYAPLAHRFGLGRIRWELEDWSFRWLHEDDYVRLVAMLDQTRTEREAYIRQVVEPLDAALRQEGVDASLTGRPKHLYSIWRKMREKELVDLDSVHDLNAVRVITTTISDCYAALGVVHGMWTPITGRFKDYIALPKSNLYQSLHTTVIGPLGRGVEVQVRTRDMDRLATEGIAAHWAYKEGQPRTDRVEAENRWVRQILSWQKDASDSRDFLDLARGDLAPQEIFVYSPRGDLVQLPKGSIPVDFAFEIHTDLGLRCAGARVDGRIVPLFTELHSGQTIEIIRSESAHPTRDWLRWVRSSKAKAAVRRWLRQAETDADRDLGREILRRELSRRGLEKLPVDVRELLRERLNVDSDENLMLRLGRGDLHPGHLAGILPPLPPRRKPRRLVDRFFGKRREKTRDTDIDGDEDAVLVGGQHGIPFHRAGCCQPLPGEPILGWVSQGRGISLHRDDCLQGRRLASVENRWIDVAWHPDASTHEWDAVVEVTARDRPFLLRDLSQSLSLARVNVLRASIATVGDSVRDRFRVKVHDAEQMERCLQQLRGVSGVLQVVRLVGERGGAT